MADPPAAVLVIGYGSELRRDDAAGRRVVEAVERQAPAGATVVTTTQLVPELGEPIAAADRVVFVDASIDATDVSVRRLPVQAGSTGSHHVTPSELLGLVSALGLPCPPAFLVEVPASDLTLGEGLSAATSAAVQHAVDEVAALIAAAPATDRSAEDGRTRPVE